MEITYLTFLIVCPLMFLAGLVDAIGGGGGLISLPAFLIAGLPPHAAIATNKMSSVCGTALATLRFIKNKLVDFRLAIPSVIAAIIGSVLGAKCSLLINETIILYMTIGLLPICAVLVLNKNLFHDNEDNNHVSDRRIYIIATVSALVIGMYDGFYGPGSGTFLLIAFTVLAKFGVKTANARAKVINLTSNIASLLVFLFSGEVMLMLGLVSAVCNMIGGYIGAGLVMKNGAKIAKPAIIFVLILLAIKIFGEL